LILQNERHIADMRESFRGDPFIGSTHPHQRREQTREARRPQRFVGLSRQTTQPFDRRSGVMADAIDREKHTISPAHEARQQPRAMFDTAVVMEKARADALDQSFQLGNLMRPAADVQYRDAGQLEGFTESACFRLDDRGNLVFDKLKLLQS
jgi:hypothetical protein